MRALLVCLCLVTACGSDALAPQAPALATATMPGAVRRPLPPLDLSVVDAPISYALAPALDALERSVPRRFGNMEKRLRAGKSRTSAAFSAVRTPFDVSFDGRRLTLSTIVSYQGRGWYNPPLAPEVSASCGTDGARPRLRVVITSDLDVDTAWRLHTRTRLRTLTPLTDTDRDQCRVTLFKINVTDRVVEAVRPHVARQLPALDRKIAAFDVQQRVERWYNLLNKPIRVKDSLWLVLAPEQVRLGGLHLEDTALVADVRLLARPLLVSGARPATITTTLPALEPAQRTVGDSSHLLLEGLLTYDATNAVLRQQLVGRHFSRYGRRVNITSARLYPLGDGRVALELGLSGLLSGNAYFVGTPHLDTTAHALTVPDLDFDVSTANALVRGLAWFKKADVVRELRARARVPLDPLLEDTREKVEHALNRELADGVRLTGHVQTGRLVDVVAEPRWLVVRAEATGSLGLGIDRELSIRRRGRNSKPSTAATGAVTK